MHGQHEWHNERNDALILYFSATGNSLHVARSIAATTGDQLLDIAACMKKETFNIELADGEALGIITPVYDWILPSIVDEFLDKLTIRLPSSDHYTFLVITYGTTPGAAATVASQHMAKKGLALKALFSVQMPDTWTPTFDLSDSEKVHEMNEKADRQIKGVMEKIRTRQEGDFMQRRLPKFVIGPAKANYKHARRTSHLHVSDACIGCGLCAKGCPTQAIAMKDGKPTWVKSQRAMCLRCLHRCPKFAIQYDNRTQQHGQYVHPRD